MSLSVYIRESLSIIRSINVQASANELEQENSDVDDNTMNDALCHTQTTIVHNTSNECDESDDIQYTQTIIQRTESTLNREQQQTLNAFIDHIIDTQPYLKRNTPNNYILLQELQKKSTHTCINKIITGDLFTLINNRYKQKQNNTSTHTHADNTHTNTHTHTHTRHNESH